MRISWVSESDTFKQLILKISAGCWHFSGRIAEPSSCILRVWLANVISLGSYECHDGFPWSALHWHTLSFSRYLCHVNLLSLDSLSLCDFLVMRWDFESPQPLSDSFCEIMKSLLASIGFITEMFYVPRMMSHIFNTATSKSLWGKYTDFFPLNSKIKAIFTALWFCDSFLKPFKMHS